MTLASKFFFGKAGGMFQQCPSDPAMLHLVRDPGRDDHWPSWPAFMNMAWRLAG